VENKHTKLINEHYAMENEHYRKESTRTTVWKTSIAQISTRITLRKTSITQRSDEHYGGRHAHYKKESTFSITVGTEHSAGKGCSPGVQMGIEREGEQKERFPYKI
jgi:hypothetical protein